MADDAIEARLTRTFVDQVIDVLELVEPAAADEAGLGDDLAGVTGYFKNAQRAWKLRDEAAVIERALGNAR